MSKHDELIETLKSDPPYDRYSKDEDFDNKIWYRDGCRRAAVGMTELVERNTELEDAIRDCIVLINDGSSSSAIHYLTEILENSK